MHNYYLLNEAYQKATIDELQQNLILLNTLISEKRETEFFHYHQSLYSLNTDIGLFTDLIFNQLPNKQFRQNVLPRLLNRDIKKITDYCENEDKLDESFPDEINGFYGVNFDNLEVSDGRCFWDSDTYRVLKYNFDLINGFVFWEQKKELFDRIKFCDSIKDNEKYFLGLTNQKAVIDKLSSLEIYCLDHYNEAFNFDDFTDKAGVNCSPESQTTLKNDKFSAKRKFQLPNGEYHIFSWHLKIGDTRVYFYPADGVVYIPYIGVHLPTKKFKK